MKQKSNVQFNMGQNGNLKVAQSVKNSVQRDLSLVIDQNYGMVRNDGYWQTGLSNLKTPIESSKGSAKK